MKYLKAYKIFEDDQRNSIWTRVSGRRDTAKAAIPEFISKMVEMINTNYEIFDIDENLISNRLKENLTAGKGKVKIEYREVCNTKGIDNTGRIIVPILNFGYSLGYYKADMVKGHPEDLDVYFSDWISEIVKCLHFEKVSNTKLVYNGPNVLSSSITASSFNTKQSIEHLEDTIERHFNGDSEIGEISILIGCIYQYGFGLGNDTSYIETMDMHNKLLAAMKNNKI